MRLARLAALERKKIEDELKEVLKEIAYLEGLLADPKKILGLIKEDYGELKEKYGDERRTRIQDVSGVLTEEDLIPNVDVLVTLTKRGYVKRIPRRHLSHAAPGRRGVTGVTMREEDDVQHILPPTRWTRCCSSPTGAASTRSRSTRCPTPAAPPRACRSSISWHAAGRDGHDHAADQGLRQAEYLFFTTRLGQVKRTALNLFQSVRSTGLIAIGLEPATSWPGSV